MEPAASPTPGRSSGRPGVLLSTLIGAAALAALAGCDALGGGATIQLDSAEVDLGSGADVHEVAVGGSAAADSIVPDSVNARPGDAIRFVTTDNRPHAVTFDADGLSADVREYLERTAQLRGPPLVSEGTAWVVVLRDAPPGRYPFHCRSHDTGGVLRVTGG